MFLQQSCSFMSKNILTENNIRVTPIRLQVLEVFNRFDNALSLQTIEQEIGKHDRITLYRTLKTFTEKGIIHEIAMLGGEKHLALCSNDCEQGIHNHQHEHIHFQCKNCNNVFCVEIDDFPQIKLEGFELSTIEITAQGKCKNCMK